MTSLSKATEGRIVNDLDDLHSDDLGTCGMIREERIGEHIMTHVEDCADPKSLSIILRGGTNHVVEEIERAFDDAVGVVSLVLNSPQIVSGGGSVHAVLSRDLRQYAGAVGGRKQMAVLAFADALEVIPSTLAENAGIDPVDAMIELRQAHSSGYENADASKCHYGIYISDEEDNASVVADMLSLQVVEPKKVI